MFPFHVKITCFLFPCLPLKRAMSFFGLRFNSLGKHCIKFETTKTLWQMHFNYGFCSKQGELKMCIKLLLWLVVCPLFEVGGSWVVTRWYSIVSYNLNNTIHWWLATTNSHVTIFMNHCNLVKGMTWDLIGSFFTTQSNDKSIIIWCINNWG